MSLNTLKKNQQTTYEKLKNLNKFKPGDKILITEGVFKSCTAIFKSSRADDRFILLMNILGQEQSININKDYTMAL
jgi:transcription antitermination factor NusG